MERNIMAEYCFDCWKQLHGRVGKGDVVLSKELDLCEGCGEWKHVVVSFRNFGNDNILGWVSILLKYIGKALLYIGKILKILCYNLIRKK